MKKKKFSNEVLFLKIVFFQFEEKFDKISRHSKLLQNYQSKWHIKRNIHCFQAVEIALEESSQRSRHVKSHIEHLKKESVIVPSLFRITREAAW